MQAHNNTASPSICPSPATKFEAPAVTEAAAPEPVAEAVLDTEGVAEVMVALAPPAATAHSFPASVIC